MIIEFKTAKVSSRLNLRILVRHLTLPTLFLHFKQFKELITGWYAVWRRLDVIAAVALILGRHGPISSLELAIQRLCNCRTSLIANATPSHH